MRLRLHSCWALTVLTVIVVVAAAVIVKSPIRVFWAPFVAMAFAYVVWVGVRSKDSGRSFGVGLLLGRAARMV